MRQDLDDDTPEQITTAAPVPPVEVSVPRRVEEVETLAARAARGCHDALADLYEKTVDPLYRFLYLRTCNHHATEDLTSETWLAAARSIRSYTYRPGHGFTAWLFTIARNKLADYFGSKYATRTEYLPPEDMLEVWCTVGSARAVCPSVNAQVHDAVTRLPAKQREVVVLADIIGLTLDEAAGVLGRKPAAVRKAHARAVTTLRSTLAGIDPSEAIPA